ncbi:MAG: hypothetical protein AAFQ02_09645, partial [Bacteroidota bacterium]
SNYYIEGLWVDDYGDFTLEIRERRRSIRVRIDGRRWRSYNKMGRGVFDDCAGSVIVLLDNGSLRFKPRNRRTRLLFREGRSFGRDRFSPGRNGFDSPFGYNDGRSGLRSNRSGARFCDPFAGNWFCDDRGLSLTVEVYGTDIRARRRGGRWTYYTNYNDRYFVDRRGNRCFFDGNDLVWSSRDRRQRYRFRRI